MGVVGAAYEPTPFVALAEDLHQEVPRQLHQCVLHADDEDQARTGLDCEDPAVHKDRGGFFYGLAKVYETTLVRGDKQVCVCLCDRCDPFYRGPGD